MTFTPEVNKRYVKGDSCWLVAQTLVDGVAGDLSDSLRRVSYLYQGHPAPPNKGKVPTTPAVPVVAVEAEEDRL